MNINGTWKGEGKEKEFQRHYNSYIQKQGVNKYCKMQLKQEIKMQDNI